VSIGKKEKKKKREGRKREIRSIVHFMDWGEGKKKKGGGEKKRRRKRRKRRHRGAVCSLSSSNPLVNRL